MSNQTNLIDESRMKRNSVERGKKQIPKESDQPSVIIKPDPQSEGQKSLRLKNIVEFAKFSYELEVKREQSLINQSGQMLTAFSVVSATLLMGVPLFIDYTSIPNDMVLISVAITLVLMLISMVLAVVSQWRFKYVTMMTGEELLQKVEADIYSHVHQIHYDYQWVDQLKKIQESKKKNNDKRYMLIHASMIIFFCAIASIIIGLVISVFKK